MYDIRNHMDLYNEDLACRTIEDRLAMIQKHYGVAPFEFTNASEKVQLLEDRSGERKGGFCDGFCGGVQRNTGRAWRAGVLARKGNVYFTDIPNLWLLRDTNGDGKADVRQLMSRGYGVHFGYSGHDLHGLRIGPDGKLYFTMADRGLHVRTKKAACWIIRTWERCCAATRTAATWKCSRCGLRNPQKLAFDDYGDLVHGRQ